MGLDSNNIQKTNIIRHGRQVLLPEWGGMAQQKLRAAHVVMVGAGGLGAPVGLYLAAAGVGKLTIIDADKVEASNLNRQVVFTTGDIGKDKASAAAARLLALDPNLAINAIVARLESDKLAAIQSAISGPISLIIDGTDNFTTRFLVNDWAVARNIPLVSGAVRRWQGQVGLFVRAGDEKAACYQCFVPTMPPDDEPCALQGILGAMTGVIGTQMAMLALRQLGGLIEKAPKLGLYDGLTGEWRHIGLPQDRACAICGGGHEG